MPFMVTSPPPTWYDRMAKFVRQELAAAPGEIWGILREAENATADEWTTTVTGSGAVTQNVAGDVQGGVYNLASGATANSTASLHVRGAVPWLAGGSAEKWALAWRGRITTAIVASTPQVGWGTATLAGVFEVFFGVRGPVSTGFFVLLTNVDDTISTKAFDQLWHDFVIISDGTNLRVFVDGVQVASRASVTAAVPLMVKGHSQNGAADATNRAQNMDKVALFGLNIT